MAMKCDFRLRTYNFLILLFIMILAFACSKPQIQFNSVNNGDNVTNIVEVDTFSVKLSSVFLDSFTTSNTKTQLLGRYTDPYFGTTTSRSYTDIGTPSPLPTLDNFSVYDSIVLITRINRTFYGDTSKVQRFLVSQLTQVMDLPANQFAFYNNNSIPSDPLVLGSTDVMINPTAGLTSQRAGDSVKIKLPNSLGTQLFDLLYRQSDTVKNANTWRGYFKGLTVYPDTTLPGAIYGFRDTMVMRIYYHEPGPIISYRVSDFHIVNEATQFNQITSNRAGTPLATISQSNTEIPSSATGNQAFLQPITSMYIKMLFPTISDLQGYPDYLAIAHAQLVIKPVQGTYSPLFNLPRIANLALTNEGNTIGLQLNVGTGNLNIDYLYGTNTSYTYDITSYIQAAITQGALNNSKNVLMFIVPTPLFNTTFNRAVIGDSHNAQTSNQIILQIFYA